MSGKININGALEQAKGDGLAYNRGILSVAGTGYLWLCGYIFLTQPTINPVLLSAAASIGIIALLMMALSHASKFFQDYLDHITSVFFILNTLFAVFFMWDFTDKDPALLFIVVFTVVSTFQLTALRYIVAHNVLLFLSLIVIHQTGKANGISVPPSLFFGSLIISSSAAGIVQYLRMSRKRKDDEQRMIAAGLIGTTDESWMLVSMPGSVIKYAGRRAMKQFGLDKQGTKPVNGLLELLEGVTESDLMQLAITNGTATKTVSCRKSTGEKFRSVIECVDLGTEYRFVFCRFSSENMAESLEGKTLQTAMRYRYYLNLTDEGIILCDQDGRIGLINRKAQDILSLEPNENHTSRHLREVVPSNIWMKASEYINSGLNFEKNYAIEDPLFGAINMRLEHIQDLFDASGQTFIRLTKQEQQQQSNVTIVTENPEGHSVSVVSIDLQGTILRANEGFCKTTGYSTDELASLGLGRIIHPSDVEAFEKALLAPDSMDEEPEFRIISKSGKTRHLRMEFRALADESTKGVTITVVDVTGYINSNDALAQAVSNVNAVVENSDDTIFSIDFNYRFTVMNSACEQEYLRRTGHLPVTGDDLRWYLNEQQSETWTRMVKQALAGMKVRFEEVFTYIDNAIHHFEISLNPIQTQGASVLGVSVHMRNITERVMNEQRMVEAKDAAERATKEKSEFLSTMSHEIRTPLNGLLGMTELLLTTNLSGKQKEFADSIRLSGEALLSVISDILDHSRIESGKLEFEEKPFELRSCILDTFNIVSLKAKEQGDKLSYKVDEFLPSYFNGDKARIRQILVNLVGNAVKFTKDGQIAVHVTGHKTEQDDWELQFDVTDTGIGMNADQTQKIFESFTQADASTYGKYGGSGLGLSISSRLAARMKGKIWVESEPGKGSVFSFTIRLKPVLEHQRDFQEEEVINQKLQTVTQKENKAAGMLDSLSSDYPMRIMVAEDNTVNQTLARIIFQRLGYEPDMAENGQAAVELAALRNYDIIFMDVQMPIMDGIEATKTITSSLPTGKQPPVIVAMTAYAMDGDRDKCKEAGMIDYLSKPVTIDDIRRLLIKYGEQFNRQRSSTAPKTEATTSNTETILFDDTELIDMAAIDRLKQLSDPQNQFMAKLVMLFMEQADGSIEEIKKHFADGNAVLTSKAAHKLKGSAMNVGAARLSKLCASIERSAINNELGVAAQWVESLENCNEASKSALAAVAGIK
ncbi:MAG: ATP-binding protein [Bacteroidota bacterium]